MITITHLQSLLLILLPVLPLCGQGMPKLNSLSREWLQRGTSVQVSASGENLGAAKEVLISGAPGLTATIIPPVSTALHVESSLGGISSATLLDGSKLTLSVTALTNASLTDRELRIVTSDGVSNPLPIRVGHLSEIDSAPSNNSRETAQSIELPAAISGSIAAAAESDFFRFKATKGQHIIFDLYAERLSGSPLDSSLAVLDKEGREIARNEDSAGLDSILDFNVPEDSEYIVQLRDFRHQGGGNYKYRLIAGATPHAFSTFPFGGRRGQTVEVALQGVNLDGVSKILLALAPDAPIGRQDIRASTPRGLSNPFPFDVSDLPQVMEKEPNTALDQADAISIPAVLNGKIDKENDYDAFKFRAEKDQQIVFEVQAYRFGSPLDALLTIADDRGNLLQRNDDSAASDARIDHRFPASGEYHLIIEDLLGRGGDNFGYRITATIPQPNFSVTFLPDTPRLRRGGRVPIRVEIARANGFSEAVKVTAEELSSGIHVEPLLITSPDAGLLVLSARPETELGSFPLKLRATSSINGQIVARQAQPLSGDKPAKAGFITLLDAAPFAIAPATLMASIEQNQSAKIDVVVERKDGFAGEIKISPEGFSAGRDPVTRSFDFQPLSLKGTDTRGTLSLKTKLDSEIGTRPIILRAEADVAGQTVSDYSDLIPVATTQIPFVLSTSLKKLIVTALPSGGTSAAAEAVFSVKVERRAGFAGEIELKMEGVPEGVVATIERIPAGAAETTVKLVASEKTPTGKDFQLNITGTGLHNDRTYKFQPAAVTLTINAPEPAETKDPKLAGPN